MTASATSTEGHAAAGASGFWALTLGSIGVVFGDIGTSPLYAFREAATGAAQVQDGEGNFSMADFAEYWAELLTHQHWFEESQRLCV